MRCSASRLDVRRLRLRLVRLKAAPEDFVEGAVTVVVPKVESEDNSAAVPQRIKGSPGFGVRPTDLTVFVEMC